MRTMTATDASRGFSDLLDAAEAGETVIVTRGGRPIARISPARSTTGRDLRAALADVPRLDPDLADDIAGATAHLTADGDPWRDA
ncbi:MAG TPA: type II toxin-antitoxin system prevent-host-death family antitoxin [Cellulomonas sp.]|nr:type II toxin-antitoxin system prevent-host-death family antitoxin [Cellulomonas sp.]